MKRILLILAILFTGCSTNVSFLGDMKIHQIISNKDGYSYYYASALDGLNDMGDYCFYDRSDKFKMGDTIVIDKKH